jgi:4-methylaminobutanoate oxidase (formaldehyde-forming)
VWSTDITSETTPYDAGLGFCVKLDKPGGFEGREALVAAKAPGLSRRLSCLTLADRGAVALGGEPVRVAGEVLGRVTSGGFGYTVDAPIAYGYLPVEVARPGTEVEVNVFGEWVAGAVVRQPLVDPDGTRTHADG